MNNFILEKIRHSLLQQLDIRIISPSDCAVIALAINKKLQKNISETTIKRLFGFAAHQTQFSKFTVNTLIEFVEDQEVAMIDALPLQGDLLKAEENWDFLQNNARLISENTIKKVANSCTIPYECAIDRKFVTHDFDYLYQSDYSLSTFVAQAGYGKSILLSKLVQQHFLNPAGKYHEDILLYLSAYNVFKINQDEQNIGADLQQLLGLSSHQNLVAFFDEQYQKTGKKLIIIFDNFHDLLRQYGQKHKVFERIIQLLSEIGNSRAIKVVLSMRPYIWRRFFETIRHSHFLKNKWFPGNYFRPITQSNVPLLTETEIDLILSNLHANGEIEVNDDIKLLFKYPFYISYYYLIRNDYPYGEYTTNLILHEIILRYLLDKIYQTDLAVEKIIICKRIIQLTDLGKEGTKIKKKLLLEDNHFFKKAYRDLLLDGILTEEINTENGLYVEYVQFVQPKVFNYFLFKENAEKHKHHMDASYFNAIFESYQNDRKQLCAILKWSIFHLIKHNNCAPIKHVLGLTLTYEEHNELLLFLAENIKHQTKIAPNAELFLSSCTLHQAVIKKLIHLDFLDPSYQQILTILTEISSDEETLATYHALLSLFYGLRFDIPQLQKSLAKLEKIRYGNKWYINPLEFTQFLLLKLNGSCVSNHPVSLKLAIYRSEFASLRKKDIVLVDLTQKISGFYLIAVSWIFGNPTDTVQLIHSIHHSCGVLYKKSQSYSFYLLHILALEIAKSGPGKTATRFERIISHFQEFNPEHKTSQWSKQIAELISAYQCLHENNHELAIKKALNCLSWFKRQDYIALAMMCYQLLVKINTSLNDIDTANDYKYLILNQLQQRNISARVFDQPTQFGK